MSPLAVLMPWSSLMVTVGRVVSTTRLCVVAALVLPAAGSLLSKSWGTTLLFQKINGKLIKELWRFLQFLHPDLVFEELDALDRPPANSEASSPNKNKHSYMRL